MHSWCDSACNYLGTINTWCVFADEDNAPQRQWGSGRATRASATATAPDTGMRFMCMTMLKDAAGTVGHALIMLSAFPCLLAYVLTTLRMYNITTLLMKRFKALAIRHTVVCTCLHCSLFVRITLCLGALPCMNAAWFRKGCCPAHYF